MNINISPETIEIRKHENFVSLHMESADRRIDVVALFDSSHINKLHDMLNELYEIRAKQDKAEIAGN
jgi:hypothetical protein